MLTERHKLELNQVYVESVQLMGDFFSSFFFSFAKTQIGMKSKLPVTIYNVKKGGA
jgi:hypothetical protein